MQEPIGIRYHVCFRSGEELGGVREFSPKRAIPGDHLDGTLGALQHGPRKRNRSSASVLAVEFGWAHLMNQINGPLRKAPAASPNCRIREGFLAHDMRGR